MEVAEKIKKKSGDMRSAMPQTTAFVDAMREAFGVDDVNEVIKKGMRGHAWHFWASENGHEIGTKSDE
jgi:hypothetical protein